MTNRSQTTMPLFLPGQGLGALKGLSLQSQKVYEVIVRRFLSIFYPPASLSEDQPGILY